MKMSIAGISIIGFAITLLLGSQFGVAAGMMDQEKKKMDDMAPAMIDQSDMHSMDNEMKDSMGAEHMDEKMKSPMHDKMDDSKGSMDKMMEADPDKMKMDQGMTMKKKYTVPSDAELRKQLTPLQYRVTRKDGTEPAYNNLYWNNKEAGLYVDVISGVPLFSSTDKYASGTGWPSFTRPINSEAVFVKEDRSLFMTRNEVRSKLSDAHLGHVFDDGPKPTGLRYCMNSAALKFVPVEELEAEGYGNYVSLFK